MLRIRRVLLSLIIAAALVVFYVMHCSYSHSSRPELVHISRPRLADAAEMNNLNAYSRPGLVRKKSPDWADAAEMNNLSPVGRVVDTPSCVIPDFDPYNPVATKTLKDPSPIDITCNASWPMLTDVVDGHVVQINVNLSLQLNVSYCEYQEVCQCTVQ